MEDDAREMLGRFNEAFQPLTTKAGQKVLALVFSGPPRAAGQPQAVTLKAAYPMQFLVRVDAHRWVQHPLLARRAPFCCCL